MEASLEAPQFEKLAALLHKAEEIKSGFDFEKDDDEYSSNDLPGTTNGRPNPPNRNKFFVPLRDQEVIKKMQKEKWNINLRKVMPKEIRFEYDFDLPLFRALIFLVCYNRRLGIDFHNKPGFGFSGKLPIDTPQPKAIVLTNLIALVDTDNVVTEPESYYSKPIPSHKEENADKKRKKETTKNVNMIGDYIKKKTMVYQDDVSPGEGE
jgi:hypothetical protein